MIPIFLLMLPILYIVLVFSFHDIKEPRVSRYSEDPWRMGHAQWMDDVRTEDYRYNDSAMTVEISRRYSPEVIIAYEKRKLIFYNMEVKETRVSYSLEGLVR